MDNFKCPQCGCIKFKAVCAGFLAKTGKYVYNLLCADNCGYRMKYEDKDPPEYVEQLECGDGDAALTPRRKPECIGYTGKITAVKYAINKAQSMIDKLYDAMREEENKTGVTND